VRRRSDRRKLGPMRAPRRLASALLLTALAALGVAERAALHAHPLEESDLVPHALALVAAGGPCGASPHFDSATLGDHPVCVECVLAAAAVAVAPSPSARLGDGDSRRLAAPAVAPAAAWLAPRARDARGPPAA
jgi:hypothetical protein